MQTACQPVQPVFFLFFFFEQQPPTITCIPQIPLEVQGGLDKKPLSLSTINIYNTLKLMLESEKKKSIGHIDVRLSV